MTSGFGSYSFSSLSGVFDSMCPGNALEVRSPQPRTFRFPGECPGPCESTADHLIRLDDGVGPFGVHDRPHTSTPGVSRALAEGVVPMPRTGADCHRHGRSNLGGSFGLAYPVHSSTTFRSTNSGGPSYMSAIVALAACSPSWRRRSCSRARAFSSLSNTTNV